MLGRRFGVGVEVCDDIVLLFDNLIYLWKSLSMLTSRIEDKGKSHMYTYYQRGSLSIVLDFIDADCLDSLIVKCFNHRFARAISK